MVAEDGRGPSSTTTSRTVGSATWSKPRRPQRLITDSRALPFTPPLDAVTVTQPVLFAAVNVAAVPAGYNLPYAPEDSVHAGTVATAFPYASVPVAVSLTLLP
jgi:hypothetical protein